MNIAELTDKLKTILNVARKPVTQLPPILAYCSLAQRPGLSVIVSVGNVIKAQAEIGVPTGTLPDGTPNLMNQWLTVLFTENYRAMHEDAVVELFRKPGDLMVSGAYGPSTNIDFAKSGEGQVR